MAENQENPNTANQTAGLHSLPRRQIMLTLAGVMLAIFLSSLDQTIVSTALPRIISDLGGFSHYTWVSTGYMITSTVTVPITGKLTDMYGRKRFYIAGIAIFLVGSLLCGLSQTMNQLIIFRMMQGVGAGIMAACAIIVIGDLFPPAERGKYMGLFMGVYGISSIIGPMLGGFITDNISWHWIFFINIPLGMLILGLFISFFPDLRPANISKHKIDYAGIATLMLGMVSMMLALTWAGVEHPWLSAQIIGLFSLSAAALTLFVMIESRSSEPLIPLWLFSNRIVSISLIVAFITSFCMFGGIIFIPLFFQGVLGASATTSGSFLTPMMLGLVAGSIISGQLLSRAGGHYRTQLMVGLAIIAAGMALLSRMTVDTSYAQAVANIVLIGFGQGMVMPNFTIAVQNAVPYDVMGVASSSSVFFRSLGGALGLAVFGSVMNNRFTSEFLSNVSPEAKKVISPEPLNSLAHNPQALVNSQSQDQLRGIFEQAGPHGATLFDQVMGSLREALSSAITEVFLIGLILIIAALAASLFIKEIPLRKYRG